MESKFKVGDRIKIYGFDKDNATKAYVREITAIDEDGMIETNGIKPGMSMFSHPKQCRKLVKKPRRRVWIKEEELELFFHSNEPWGMASISVKKIDTDDVEFIEVKKK